jgi:hypothetical protein
MKINAATWIQPDALPLATSLGINDKTTIVSASDCIEPLDQENYVIIGVLNKILHANHDLSHDDNRGPFSKKAKKNYNRIAYFGDVSPNAKGANFAIKLPNEEESRNCFSFCRDMIGVGTLFIIWEPTPTGSALRLDMPFIETTQPIFPLQEFVYSLLDTTLPTVPSSANETSFFLLHGQSLKFIRTELRGKGDQKQPSCSGKLCDRKEVYKANNACGCFKADPNLSSGVIELSIISEHINVRNNRSLRLTDLLVKNADLLARLNPTERATHKEPLRLKVKDATTYINTNAGFTIAGYVNRGESMDASDQTEKVASEKVLFHVTYCYPTDLTIPTQEGFKTFIYNHNAQPQNTILPATITNSTQS